MRWMECVVAAVVVTSLAACGDDAGPTSPGSVTVPTVVDLTGNVSATVGGTIANATVRILDGANAGRTATSGSNGQYTFGGLTPGNANLSASASGYVDLFQGINIGVSNVLDFRLTPVPAPPFTISGTGDTVFDIPRTVSRIRIQGRYTGNSSNFVVYIAGRLIVNELLGTGWSSTTFEGTYLTSGGVAEIRMSSGVAWTFTEVR